MNELKHITVLREATVDPLLQSSGSLYVDGTLGGGGHVAYLFEKKPTARVIGIDRDAAALERVKTRFQEQIANGQLRLVQDSFENLPGILSAFGESAVDGIILDLGFSSFQVDDPGRGFSFMKDGPLDMRMDPSRGDSAADVLADCSAQELEKIFRDYGEERFARRVADFITRERVETPLQTTQDLVRLIDRAIPAKFRRAQKIHPSTRVFQALRIFVNQEISALENFLGFLPDILNPGGVASIISFHSLEDRPVKQRFKFLSDDCICPPPIMTCARCHKPPGRLLTKKPLIANEEETSSNPRSRSAKLRVFQRAK